MALAYLPRRQGAQCGRGSVRRAVGSGWRGSVGPGSVLDLRCAARFGSGAGTGGNQIGLTPRPQKSASSLSLPPTFNTFLSFSSPLLIATSSLLNNHQVWRTKLQLSSVLHPIVRNHLFDQSSHPGYRQRFWHVQSRLYVLCKLLHSSDS